MCLLELFHIRCDITVTALHQYLEPVLSSVALSTVEEQLRSVVLLAFGYEQSRLAKLCSMQWPVAQVDAVAMQSALTTLHGHLLCAYLTKVGHERAGSDPNYNLEHDPQLVTFLQELTNLQNNVPNAAAATAVAVAVAPAPAPAPAAPRAASAQSSGTVQKPRLTPAQQFQRAPSTSWQPQQQQAGKGAHPSQPAPGIGIQSSRSHDADRSRSADQKRTALLGAGPRPQLPANAGPSTPTLGSQSAGRQGPELSWLKRDSPLVPGAHPLAHPPQNSSTGSSSSTTSTPTPVSGAGVGTASKPRAPSLLQSPPSPAAHSSSPLLPKPTGAPSEAARVNNSRAAAASTAQSQQSRLSSLSSNQTPASAGVGSPAVRLPLPSEATQSTTPLALESLSGDSTDSVAQKPQPPGDSAAAPPAEEKPAHVEELPLGPPGLRFKKFAYSNSLESEAN